MAKWKVITDANYYRAPFTPKQFPVAYKNTVLDKGSILLFLRGVSCIFFQFFHFRLKEIKFEEEA